MDLLAREILKQSAQDRDNCRAVRILFVTQHYLPEMGALPLVGVLHLGDVGEREVVLVESAGAIPVLALLGLQLREAVVLRRDSPEIRARL